MENGDNIGLSDIIDILNTLDDPNNGTTVQFDTQTTQNRTAATTSAVAKTTLPPHPLHQSSSSPLFGQSSMQLASQHVIGNSNMNSRGTSTLSGNTSVSKPYIHIVEQPASKALRFRYECEGRSAGSIPGVNSTPENKTYPTIDIVGYKGDVVVVVSCVTKDPPFRPHPHNLVGKESCKNGICTLVLTGEPLRAVFSNLGIQCVKKKDIRIALETREKMQVDPFKTKFAHKDQPSSIDLNAVRLCFQAFLKTSSGVKPLSPVVSDPIFDKKAMSDLVICRLCSCTAKVAGGDEIILLCEKISKDDIKVRFFEQNYEGAIVWEDYAEFHQTDIHKQTAIAFRTPRYHNADIVDRAKVFVQLMRPTDGVTSDALPFEYYPDPGMRTFTRIRRKLKRKEDLEIFQQILSLDSETTITKYSCQPTDMEADNDDEMEHTVSSDSSASKPQSSDTINEIDARFRISDRRQVTDISEGDADGENVNISEEEMLKELDIELEVPQMHISAADESTQTSTPMEEILNDQQLSQSVFISKPSQLSNVVKIAEWMQASEFERTDSLTVENGDELSISPMPSYLDDVLANESFSSGNRTILSPIRKDERSVIMDFNEKTTDGPSKNGDEIKCETDAYDYDRSNKSENVIRKLEDKFKSPTASAQPSVELDETFDDNSTYTSLQIALKNPVSFPSATIANANTDVFINDCDGLTILTNPPAPKIRVNAVQTPPSPPSPPLPLPPRTPSPVMDQQLPPLPPKRKTSQEFSSNNPTPFSSMAHSLNGSISSRPPSQIIIMRTPDQSPTKRQSTPTPTPPSPKKKQSFFSRFFSRRKSKNEQAAETAASSRNSMSLPRTNNLTDSNDLSMANFSINDPHRSSIRSVRSMEPALSQNSVCIEHMKGCKPVGRSLSSASGKRPAHISADVIHIPLKGESSSASFTGSASTTITFGQHFDRRTLSALQLADIPICDGNLELVAIADRQSIKNLCDGSYGVVLDPSVDLFEAEHYALYTSAPPLSLPGDETKSITYYEQVEAGQIATANEVTRRLAEANGLQ